MTWETVLEGEKQKPYFLNILEFLKKEQHKTIYPKQSDIFNALKYTKLEELKVVIIGQDPYHGANQAHGLSFSVQKGVRTPPSLQNIYKELYSDLGIEIANHGCLEKWAKQGVLLLNATLTVEASKPESHAKIGWQTFTDKVIQEINEQKEGLVFLLWGAYAQRKGEMIDPTKHYVLTSPHPSPFSANRGFFGCKHFSKTNDYLRKNGQSPIDWDLNDG